MSAVQESAP